MTEESQKIVSTRDEFNSVINTLFPGLVTSMKDGSFDYPQYGMSKVGSVYYLAFVYHDESSTPKSLTPYMQEKPYINVDYYMKCGVESVTPPHYKMEYGEGPVWMTHGDRQSIEDAIRQMIRDCYV